VEFAMNEKKSDAEVIFHHAITLPTPQERAAYLAGACAGQDHLRLRVEALIEAHEVTGSVLSAEPKTDQLLVPDRALAEQPGTIIGRYKLLEQIGEGGFGVVYMAEQLEPVVRRVALEIIKLGMDTKQVIARFEAERQALASMDHPNIAKVLDAGATDTGRPYFVMDLVQGISVTRFCREQDLSPQEILELFVAICSAIQHAHDRGIIHRDIKPSNILVTMLSDKPTPKVIDFGIAKATQQRLTEKTLFTRFAHFIGTPAYTSPEQAALSALEVDTRTDIYSLGVLLYELLTGKTPFDTEKLLSAGYDEIRRTIREEEPVKPSTRVSNELAGLSERSDSDALEEDGSGQGHPVAERLSRIKHSIKFIKGDLDWVVMKALDKDRRRRYATPKAFSEDLSRFLKHEPVLAAAPGATYRLRKFVRRHRSRLSLVAVVVVMLGLAAAFSGWQALQARAAQEAATEAVRKIEAAEAEQTRLQTQVDTIDETAHLQVLRTDKEGNARPASGLLSPDTSMIAYMNVGDAGTPIMLRDMKTGKVSMLKEASLISGTYQSGWVGSGFGAWSPDSKHVAFSWDDWNHPELLICSVDGSERVLKVHEPNVAYLPMDWSLDGMHLLCMYQVKNENTLLVLIDVESGNASRLPTRGWHARFSPDGRYVAFAGVDEAEGNLFCYDRRSEELIPLTDDQATDSNPVWSADGRHLLFNSDRRETWDLWALSIESGRSHGEAFLLRGGIGECIKHRDDDGNIVLSAHLRMEDPAFVSIEKEDSYSIGKVSRFEALSYGHRLFKGWSPDGSRIAYINNWSDRDHHKLHVLSLKEGSDLAFEPGVFVRFARWTPDGRHFALLRNKLVLLDLETGETRTVVEGLYDTLGLKWNSLIAVECDAKTRDLIIRVADPGGLPEELGDQIEKAYYAAIDLESGEMKRLDSYPPLDRVGYCSPSPDGKRFALVTNNGKNLVLTNADSDESKVLVELAPNKKGQIQWPNWSPDGRLICYGLRGQVHVVSTDGRFRERVDLGGKSLFFHTTAFHWSPDSKKLGFTLSDEFHELSLLKNVDKLIDERSPRGGH
jgi:serine/threonine protein kinase/Tol biopolymer transport system component